MDGNKNIEGYPNYFVTEDGRVWSYKTKRFIKLTLNRGGYYWLNLSRPGEIPKAHRVHRLVAKAYLGNPLEDEQDVNHIDGNKTNNHYLNLEWSNKRLNGLHAHRTGLSKAYPQKGIKHGMAKLSEEDVIEIRRLSENGESKKKIAELYSLHPGYVWHIINRKTWKHL